jgi:hypothetical protein
LAVIACGAWGRQFWSDTALLLAILGLKNPS